MTNKVLIGITIFTVVLVFAWIAFMVFALVNIGKEIDKQGGIGGAVGNEVHEYNKKVEAK